MIEKIAVPHPYLRLLGGRDALDVLTATPKHLAELLERLTPEQIEQQPAPGKWNLRYVMAHLVDCEIVWSWRFRQVLGEDNPELQPFEQDSWARMYEGYPFAQALSTWQALRGWNLALLRGLTETEKMRPARHPESGSLTLWTIASIAAGHDLHHLRSLQSTVDGFAAR